MKPKIPDRRAMEKMTSNITKLLREKNFDSLEDAQNFLKELVQNGDVIPDVESTSLLHKAQDLAYDAWELDDRRERIKLAEKALTISADCADAYNILAENRALTVHEAKYFYQQGIEAGKRALGEEFFKENEGHFWGMIETRPYMRACEGLMDCLWELGQHDASIELAHEMLKLNPNDNQGIRYILLGYLMDLGQYDILRKFMDTVYTNDGASEWLYTHALLLFIQEGSTKKSTTALKKAIQWNQHVPNYLTRKKKIPKNLPDMMTLRGEDEALIYASRHIANWEKIPGAIQWLVTK